MDEEGVGEGGGLPSSFAEGDHSVVVGLEEFGYA
jgi:hypothetical protein